MVLCNLNKSVLKIRFRDSAVFPPWVQCALSNTRETFFWYFENSALFQLNKLVFYLLKALFIFSESLVPFRRCKKEFDSLPYHAHTRG